MRSPYRSRPVRSVPRRGEQGWVLLATIVLSAIAASISVAWARHAVLAKGSLEMSHGASETEEAARSGLQRARQQMRAGATKTAQEVVQTVDGDMVTVNRTEYGNEQRELRFQAARPGGDISEQAALRAHVSVIPTSGSGDEVTQLECETGDAVLAAGSLTVINSSVTYQDVELAGLFLLDAGADLTLDNVILRGTILTRAGLCDTNSPITGPARPQVNVYGTLRLLAGTELPDTAFMGPDAVVTVDAAARVDIQGMVVVDEIDLPARGVLNGLLVSKSSENVGASIRRPGHGRGAQSFPSFVVPGAERVTKMAFPTDDYTTAELDLMETFDANNY